MNIQEIINQLETLPDKIRTSELAHLEAKDKSERAKLRLEVAISMATLKSQQANATRQKAEAIIATENEKKELLTAQLEESKANAEFEYLTNQFVAVRKIASMLEKGYGAEFSGF